MSCSLPALRNNLPDCASVARAADCLAVPAMTGAAIPRDRVPEHRYLGIDHGGALLSRHPDRRDPSATRTAEMPGLAATRTAETPDLSITGTAETPDLSAARNAKTKAGM
jgi:hypothetical protein